MKTMIKNMSWHNVISRVFMAFATLPLLVCSTAIMIYNKRQRLPKQNKVASLNSPIKLRTIEAENSLKFKNSKPQPKIYWFLYVKVYIVVRVDIR